MNHIAVDFLSFIVSVIVLLVVVGIAQRAQFAWQQRSPRRRSSAFTVTKLAIVITIGGIIGLLLELQKCHALGLCR
jgi:uncharacterized membrane protein YidH (DUF202 family)